MPTTFTLAPTDRVVADRAIRLGTDLRRGDASTTDLLRAARSLLLLAADWESTYAATSTDHADLLLDRAAAILAASNAVGAALAEIG